VVPAPDRRSFITPLLPSRRRAETDAFPNAPDFQRAVYG
jgi:hypothetical protein